MSACDVRMTRKDRHGEDRTRFELDWCHQNILISTTTHVTANDPSWAVIV